MHRKRAEREATKSDIDGVNQRIAIEIGSVNTRISSEIGSVNQRISSEINGVNKRISILQWMIGLCFTGIIAILILLTQIV